MIPRRTVLALGLAQLVSWGITYYLVGGLGNAIAGSLGRSHDLVYGGFSAALLVMALASPLAGRLIDRHGGRRVMIAGAVGNALGLAGIAAAHGAALYFAAWIVLGVAMRLTLYEAAFAALARIAGPGARRPMAQITLLGGLASTVFWPLGHAIAGWIGWRSAVLVYAGFALATIPLHLGLSDRRHDHTLAAAPSATIHPAATRRGDIALAGALYAAITALASFLNAGMSSQMISILTSLGVAAATAVWIATLRGIGQSSARLAEVAFGRRLSPLTLNLVASAGLPLCFIAGRFGADSAIATLGFAIVYGASNGILTITRGTLPLLLFDPRSYGTRVGRLLVPSFVLSAIAPVMYAGVLQRFGGEAALSLSLATGALILACAALLWWRFRRDRPRG